MVKFLIIYNEMCEFSFLFLPLVSYSTGKTIFALTEFKRLQLENKKITLSFKVTIAWEWNFHDIPK